MYSFLSSSRPGAAPTEVIEHELYPTKKDEKLHSQKHSSKNDRAVIRPPLGMANERAVFLPESRDSFSSCCSALSSERRQRAPRKVGMMNDLFHLDTFEVNSFEVDSLLDALEDNTLLDTFEDNTFDDDTLAGNPTLEYGCHSVGDGIEIVFCALRHVKTNKLSPHKKGRRNANHHHSSSQAPSSSKWSKYSSSSSVSDESLASSTALQQRESTNGEELKSGLHVEVSEQLPRPTSNLSTPAGIELSLQQSRCDVSARETASFKSPAGSFDVSNLRVESSKTPVPGGVEMTLEQTNGCIEAQSMDYLLSSVENLKSRNHQQLLSANSAQTTLRVEPSFEEEPIEVLLTPVPTDDKGDDDGCRESGDSVFVVTNGMIRGVLAKLATSLRKPVHLSPIARRSTEEAVSAVKDAIMLKADDKAVVKVLKSLVSPLHVRPITKGVSGGASSLVVARDEVEEMVVKLANLAGKPVEVLPSTTVYRQAGSGDTSSSHVLFTTNDKAMARAMRALVSPLDVKSIAAERPKQTWVPKRPLVRALQKPAAAKPVCLRDLRKSVTAKVDASVNQNDDKAATKVLKSLGTPVHVKPIPLGSERRKSRV